MDIDCWCSCWLSINDSTDILQLLCFPHPKKSIGLSEKYVWKLIESRYLVKYFSLLCELIKLYMQYQHLRQSDVLMWSDYNFQRDWFSSVYLLWDLIWKSNFIVMYITFVHVYTHYMSCSHNSKFDYLEI